MERLHRFRWFVTAALVLLTVGGCYLLWRPTPPEPAPVAAIVVVTPTAVPTTTPIPTDPLPPIIVYVSGAVLRPGVYALPQGARVADALAAAGGATAAADLTQVNLARRVRDEEQVHIPHPGEAPLLAPTPLLLATAAAAQGSTAGLVNINTATAAELDNLPGIGPGYAQRIVEYRESYGPFQAIEDIQNVPGIGPATFARIRELITVR